jgi:hypothetical protein
MMGTGSSYVGEGELARIAKICHNVMLGVVIQNLCEITVLAQKAGMPRHAFLDFLNKSVMGSMFTRYKTPALVKPRLPRHLHAQAAAQGPRPRPGRRARVRGADAADLAHPRPAAADDRPGNDRSRISRRCC